MNNLHKKSNTKEKDTTTELTEERVREIIREEIRKFRVQSLIDIGVLPSQPKSSNKDTSITGQTA